MDPPDPDRVADHLRGARRKQGGSYLQRAAILLHSVGVVALALRVRKLAESPAVDARNSIAGLPGPHAC
jgi:hypothetical protein